MSSSRPRLRPRLPAGARAPSRGAARTLCVTALSAALVGATLFTLGGCAVPVTQHRVVSQSDAYAPPPPPPAPARWGVVSRVEEFDTVGRPSGAGGVVGAVVGGVLGNQFGRGAGRVATTALGAVGGAVAGNAIEQNTAAGVQGHHYRVWVRFDDGDQRAYDTGDLDGLRAGDRVSVRHGHIERA